MTSWAGTVVLRADGKELAVPLYVRLAGRRGGSGRTGWDGTFEDGPLGFETGEYEVELPDGRTGRVIVNNVRVSSGPGGTRVTGTLLGNGPAPFET